MATISAADVDGDGIDEVFIGYAYVLRAPYVTRLDEPSIEAGFSLRPSAIIVRRIGEIASDSPVMSSREAPAATEALSFGHPHRRIGVDTPGRRIEVSMDALKIKQTTAVIARAHARVLQERVSRIAGGERITSSLKTSAQRRGF
ncbi:MAG TPA: hypothetical protein VGQ46_03450 [Thermoanaerobaculia bacterium]|jgi:hypothetical protein|nr:hypothetical protein [Thermoanaerobaculia bacterium]